MARETFFIHASGNFSTHGRKKRAGRKGGKGGGGRRAERVTKKWEEGQGPATICVIVIMSKPLTFDPLDHFRCRISKKKGKEKIDRKKEGLRKKSQGGRKENARLSNTGNGFSQGRKKKSVAGTIILF